MRADFVRLFYLAASTTSRHQFEIAAQVEQRIRSSFCRAEPLRKLVPRKRWRKVKGCDIGYALAVHSCEGANSVEACTVTAFDAITAFAVPNPNYSSREPSVFSGLAALRVAPPS